jgi:hypothetical protein
MLDHVEPELEEPIEQVLAEDPTNLPLNQGKPRCIPPKYLCFIFETLFIILLYCALRFSFPIILVYPCYNSYRSIELARRRYRC